MNILDWNQLDSAGRAEALRRPTRSDDARVRAGVAAILGQVREQGDAALRDITGRLDAVALDSFAVTAEEFAQAASAIDASLTDAMCKARENLLAWHRAGMAAEFEIETTPGVVCGRILRGIRRAGLYVPAGSAPLPSTALMLGVPAQLAGCAEVVLCTPPRRDGSADPAVLVAAELCGIRRVFKLGGAQAIAAMALGTESVPACDKLFGPGNAWVTEAKRQASAMAGGPAIDMPAGPSEVLVIADGGANSRFVAADLLSQAEHGADSQVLLVSDSEQLLRAVRLELERQLATLPRAEIARIALRSARLLLVDSLSAAVEVSNDYAPEHLILAVRDPRALLPRVRSAGSVFLGDLAAETFGDYCSGTNHVLPTDGAARAWSGVSVASFQTAISYQEVTRAGLRAIGPCAVEMARAEGLEAHAQSVLRRLGDAA